MFSKFGILTCDILGLLDNTIVSEELLSALQVPSRVDFNYPEEPALSSVAKVGIKFLSKNIF
jgi:hypothetical protein